MDVYQIQSLTMLYASRKQSRERVMISALNSKIFTLNLSKTMLSHFNLHIIPRFFLLGLPAICVIVTFAGFISAAVLHNATQPQITDSKHEALLPKIR